MDGSIQLIPLTKLVRKSERRFNAAEIKFVLLAGVSMTTLTACGGGGGVGCGQEKAFPGGVQLKQDLPEKDRGATQETARGRSGLQRDPLRDPPRQPRDGGVS